MEWNGATGQTQPVNKPAHTGHKVKSKLFSMKVMNLFLWFCIAVLLLAVAGYTVFGGPASQSSYVDKNKLQAVFLNGGQVYFGNIKTLNDKYVRMGNIYYLRVNQTVQPDGSSSNNNQDISLVKLGCELHGPVDEMVLNQSQVIFWENLKDDGQVAKAVAQYQKQNPNGQNCNTTSSNSNSTNTNTNSDSNSSSNSDTNN